MKKEKDWPASKIITRKVSDLVPYAKNSRTHSERQIEQIVASIREWGWTVPVLIDERGGLIAGHGRLLAAKRAGIDEVPCMVADGWSDAQKRAYVLADNKLTENGGWDNSILADELRALAEEGFALDLIAFSDFELNKLGIPGFELEDGKKAKVAQIGDLSYAVIIRCIDETDQTKLLARFAEEGLKCDALIS